MQAIFNVWFVGDQSSEDAFAVVQEMQTKADMNGEVVIPYLYEYYNVFPYTQTIQNSSQDILARLVNSLLEGLNA